jgi:hypothetical protein
VTAAIGSSRLAELRGCAVPVKDAGCWAESSTPGTAIIVTMSVALGRKNMTTNLQNEQNYLYSVQGPHGTTRV